MDMSDASFFFILIAVCGQPCMNGGVCYKPEKCTCLYGWHGKRCEKGKTTKIASFWDGYCRKMVGLYGAYAINALFCGQFVLGR